MEFLVVIAMFFMIFVYLARFFLPKQTRDQLLSALLHDIIQGVWSLIFGAPRRRIQKKEKRPWKP